MYFRILRAYILFCYHFDYTKPPWSLAHINHCRRALVVISHTLDVHLSGGRDLLCNMFFSTSNRRHVELSHCSSARHEHSLGLI